MPNSQSSKIYDLEERTHLFAKNCRDFVMTIPKNAANFEYAPQLIRSSGSTVANYIEANESFSKKDFVHRAKICRKEAKESRLWLRLIVCKDQAQDERKNTLIQEANELTKIFSSIIEKSKTFDH